MTKDIKFKGKLIIGFAVLLLAILVIGFMTGGAGSQEQKLEKKLAVVGSDFYENMYFDHIVANKSEDEVKEFFTKYIEIGIKVDLDNLARFDEEKYPNLLEEFTNKKTKEACNIRNTKAIILPKAPFGKKDYTINTEIDCGFDKAD